MGDRPKDRFSKRSNRRLKRVRKIARRIEAPEGLVIITGRSERLKRAVYVEVSTVDNLTRRTVRWYFEHKPSKAELHTEVKDMIGELL